MPKYKKKVGSRRQVWNKTAKQTQGGLKRKDLYKDKYGSLQSRKSMRKSMKKSMKKSKKNKYRKSSKKSRRSSKKSRKYRRRRSQKGGSGGYGGQTTARQGAGEGGQVNPSNLTVYLKDATADRLAPNPNSIGADGMPIYPDHTSTGTAVAGLSAAAAAATETTGHATQASFDAAGVAFPTGSGVGGLDIGNNQGDTIDDAGAYVPGHTHPPEDP